LQDLAVQYTFIIANIVTNEADTPVKPNDKTLIGLAVFGIVARKLLGCVAHQENLRIFFVVVALVVAVAAVVYWRRDKIFKKKRSKYIPL
jgi:hypothetical protein